MDFCWVASAKIKYSKRKTSGGSVCSTAFVRNLADLCGRKSKQKKLNGECYDMTTTFWGRVCALLSSVSTQLFPASVRKIFNTTCRAHDSSGISGAHILCMSNSLHLTKLCTHFILLFIVGPSEPHHHHHLHHRLHPVSFLSSFSTVSHGRRKSREREKVRDRTTEGSRLFAFKRSCQRLQLRRGWGASANCCGASLQLSEPELDVVAERHRVQRERAAELSAPSHRRLQMSSRSQLTGGTTSLWHISVWASLLNPECGQVRKENQVIVWFGADWVQHSAWPE